MDLVVDRAFVAGQCLPVGNGFVPVCALRSELASLEIFKGRFVGGDHACARAAFDGHVADGHALFHRQAADGFACEFKDMTRPAADADLGDQREDNIFGRNAFGQSPIHADFISLGFFLQEALRGEDMLHFGGADAECQRAERAMRGGVTVAADDGHAWLGATKFRSDDMDNAAMRTGHAVQGDAEFGGVGFHLLDLRRSHRIRNRDIDRRGRDGMIHRGEGFIGAADFQSALTQTCEGLRRSDFMHEVQVNVKNGWGFRLFSDNVRVPDFLE